MAVTFGLISAWLGLDVPTDAAGWVLLLFVGLGPGAVTMTLFTYSVPRLGASSFAILANTELVVVVSIGVLVLGEAHDPVARDRRRADRRRRRYARTRPPPGRFPAIGEARRTRCPRAPSRRVRPLVNRGQCRWRGVPVVIPAQAGIHPAIARRLRSGSRLSPGRQFPGSQYFSIGRSRCGNGLWTCGHTTCGAARI